MQYTIYKVTNIVNGKYYIGKHQTQNPLDGYCGSGKALVAAIKLHGKDKFRKEILHVFDNEEEMNAKERELITEEVVNDPMSYNLGVGGEGGAHFKGKKHTPETKNKQRKANQGRSNDYDRHSESRKKTFFQEGNEYWKKRKQKPCSEETKQKLREARARQVTPNLGRKMSEEQKEKIRQSLLKRNKPV
jgi:group I intron endonuclease